MPPREPPEDLDARDDERQPTALEMLNMLVYRDVDDRELADLILMLAAKNGDEQWSLGYRDGYNMGHWEGKEGPRKLGRVDYN